MIEKLPEYDWIHSIVSDNTVLWKKINEIIDWINEQEKQEKDG